MTATITARVGAGARFLDTHGLQSWWDRIDLDTLDVYDTRLCPLGQLFGSYTRACNTFAQHPDWAEDHGFAAIEDEYPALNRAWRRTILRRREASSARGFDAVGTAGPDALADAEPVAA